MESRTTWTAEGVLAMALAGLREKVYVVGNWRLERERETERERQLGRGREKQAERYIETER